MKRSHHYWAWQFLYQPDANSAAKEIAQALRRTPAPMVYIGNLGVS